MKFYVKKGDVMPQFDKLIERECKRHTDRMEELIHARDFFRDKFKDSECVERTELSDYVARRSLGHDVEI